MAESRLASGSVGTGTEMPAGSNWRRRLVGVGFALLFGDVFAAAAAGNRLGSLPKYVAAIAVTLLAIAMIGAAVNHLSSKGKRA